MKRIAMKLIVAIGVFGCLTADAFAFHQINYQGCIEDNEGNPLDGTYDFEFSIYDSPTGGLPVWTETQSMVSVIQGLFHVKLGTVVPLGLDFDGTYWLETAVNEETLLPRELFTSVPYAIRAENAEDVSGQDINPGSVSIVSYGEVIDSSGSWVGEPTGLIGPTGPTGDPGPTGDTGPIGPPGPVAGSNMQFIYNDDGSAAGAEVYYYDTPNNVGIGTVYPAKLLELAADESVNTPTLRVTNTKDDYGAGALLENPHGAIEFYMKEGSGSYPAVGAAIMAINESASGNSHGLGFFTNADLYFPTEKVRIDKDGNVGIGTTSPNAQLHLTGDFFLGGGSLIFAGTSGAYTSEDRWISGANPYIQIKPNGNSYGMLLYAATSNNCWSNIETLSGYLTLGYRTNDGPLYITENNVGIGTSNPASKLHVIGDFTATGTKNFAIDHPSDPQGKILVHAAVEGPEAAVFYRGESRLVDGKAIIKLPEYFEALTRKQKRTVQVTPLFEKDEPVSMPAASRVVDGQFTVIAVDSANPGQAFYWEVKAVRADVAPLRVERSKILLNAGQ